ncbi:hypothetical protein [Micromonospora sp. CPCC 205561]|uniref:hypothetical protein n=1 Tax=Micromonospora sp. CPCC 205561 TaxID=3122407 RepID=UPI002FF39044
MDAEAVGRPGDGPGAGAPATPAAAGDRLRTAVLVTAGLAALVGGGWWWQAEAPRTGPAVATGAEPEARGRGAAAAQSRRRVDVRVDPRTGAAFQVDPGTGAAFGIDPRTGTAMGIDPRSGATFRVDPRSGHTIRVEIADDGPDPRRPLDGRLDEAVRRGRLDGLPGTVWTVRTRLDGTAGHVRQHSAEEGARHLLRYRCFGPGELLIVIDGARAADPITSACEGSITSTEVVGRGGPFQVSLSSANTEPLRVEAHLVALS